jgi:hypothetical protein
MRGNTIAVGAGDVGTFAGGGRGAGEFGNGGGPPDDGVDGVPIVANGTGGDDVILSSVSRLTGMAGIGKRIGILRATLPRGV